LIILLERVAEERR